MVFASISSLAVTGHTHLQDYWDLSQEHTTYLLVAMPELRTQEFLRHTLTSQLKNRRQWRLMGNVPRAVAVTALRTVRYATLSRTKSQC